MGGRSDVTVRGAGCGSVNEGRAWTVIIVNIFSGMNDTRHAGLLTDDDWELTQHGRTPTSMSSTRRSMIPHSSCQTFTVNLQT